MRNARWFIIAVTSCMGISLTPLAAQATRLVVWGTRARPKPATPKEQMSKLTEAYVDHVRDRNFSGGFKVQNMHGGKLMVVHASAMTESDFLTVEGPATYGLISAPRHLSGDVHATGEAREMASISPQFAHQLIERVNSTGEYSIRFPRGVEDAVALSHINEHGVRTTMFEVDGHTLPIAVTEMILPGNPYMLSAAEVQALDHSTFDAFNMANRVLEHVEEAIPPGDHAVGTGLTMYSLADPDADGVVAGVPSEGDLLEISANPMNTMTSIHDSLEAAAQESVGWLYQ